MLRYRISNDGYILLVVLILVQVFAWVSLLELNNVAIFLKSQVKLNRNDNGLINSFYHSLANYQWQQSPCIINKVPVMTMRKKSFSWWQANTCKLVSNAYFYIEKLQTVNCSIEIKNPNQQLIRTNYYRVTLALFSDGMLAQLQQGTYATGELESTICQGIAKHPVVLGLQMRRQI